MRYFVTENGVFSSKTWLEKLKQTTWAIVARSIQKIAQGGDKKSQGRNIKKAKYFWSNYGK